MVEDSSPKDLPAATALPPRAPSRGIVIDPRVLIAGGFAALIGLGLVAVFMWMVPNAAAREAYSACRGLRGFEKLNPALCPAGKPCDLPVPAPDFTALDHQGKPVKLSDYRGKVVLLNFWASWCGVCKTEKPSLAAMTGELQSDDFVVLTLASDRNWANVLVSTVRALNPNARVPRANAEGGYDLTAALDAYRRALPDGVPFKVFLDPPKDDSPIGPITKSWGIKAVPESALIDRKGNIRAYFVNKRDWESPVAHTCLRSVIDED
jgi:thiol-disulfide isomerase/thioredoxin